MRWQSMATTWLQVLLATSINRAATTAFIQSDGSINPFFRSYLVENNEGQLLNRAGTLSQRKTKN